jgi:hypothetical protein
MNKEYTLADHAKVWHEECDTNECEVAMAIHRNLPVKELIEIALYTDDELQESYDSYMENL